jgi:hypothetical protein
MWALALGPATSDSVGWLHPYTLLTYLPGFDGLRVPARFAMLATLCVAVAAGLAFSMISPRSKNRLWLAGTIAVVGLVADGWMRAMPLLPPPGRISLRAQTRPSSNYRLMKVPLTLPRCTGNHSMDGQSSTDTADTRRRIM